MPIPSEDQKTIPHCYLECDKTFMNPGLLMWTHLQEYKCPKVSCSFHDIHTNWTLHSCDKYKWQYYEKFQNTACV